MKKQDLKGQIAFLQSQLNSVGLRVMELEMNVQKNKELILKMIEEKENDGKD